MSSCILRIDQVKEITGLSSSSIYRFISKSTFPPQVRLGKRSTGWVKSEIEQWIKDRIELSRAGGIEQ
jgi:prophage regulatory protein